MIYKAIGWSRDSKGVVLRYHLKPVVNTITSFSGGGKFKDEKTGLSNTSPYILMEYDV